MAGNQKEDDALIRTDELTKTFGEKTAGRALEKSEF